MARPKVSVGVQRVPSVTIPSRTLPSAEGVQATATTLSFYTGSVKENDNKVLVKTSTAPVVQELERAPSSQRPAVQVKTEQNCSPWPALGEKLFLETPISATVPSHIPHTFPGAEGQQATAPAIWPTTQPSDEENYSQGSTIFDEIQAWVLQRRLERSPSSQGPALLVKTEQDRSPASASISTAAVVKVEGASSGDRQGVIVSKKREGEQKASIVGKKPRAGRITLSFADLVSDTYMRLKDKAVKLGVSQTLFKNRRRDAGLGRWPGRGVRAEIKRAQTQDRA